MGYQASTGGGLSKMHPDLTLSLNYHPLNENQDKESQRSGNDSSAFVTCA